MKHPSALTSVWAVPRISLVMASHKNCNTRLLKTNDNPTCTSNRLHQASRVGSDFLSGLSVILYIEFNGLARKEALVEDRAISIQEALVLRMFRQVGTQQAKITGNNRWSSLTTDN